jgi:hypothetical protein
MAYHEPTAERIREALRRRQGFVEKKMFGGVGFLLHGNMCCGVWKASLIARIGADAYADALGEDYVREFDITGRAMTGWVMVEPDGIRDDAAMRMWLDRASSFVRALPAT